MLVLLNTEAQHGKRRGDDGLRLVAQGPDGEVPYTALGDGLVAHPTLAESLNNLFSALDG